MSRSQTQTCAASKLLLIALVITGMLMLGLGAPCESGSGQKRSGCRIHTGVCVCGIGCRSEYMYNSKDDCMKALNGQRKNQCSGNPCMHGGACSQTTMDPGYECRCEGTGFYGLRCQHECPSASAVAAGRVFPYECVVI